MLIKQMHDAVANFADVAERHSKEMQSRANGLYWSNPGPIHLAAVEAATKASEIAKAAKLAEIDAAEALVRSQEYDLSLMDIYA